MAILWLGGEDIDFPTGGTVTVDTTAGRFRSGYGRCCICATSTTTYLQSLAFSGGAVTSCWLSFRVFPQGSFINTSRLIAGLVNTSTASSGLWISTSTASKTRLSLATWNGPGTRVELAAETGDSLSNGIIHRIDMQLVNYGATANVNVYCDGTLVISITNTDVRVGSLTNVNAVGLLAFDAANGDLPCSEFIVADEDLRAFPGLVTLALTGAGTTDEWTGVFSTINQTTISDANPNFVNLNDKQQQFNVTDLPTGTFTIRAIKLAMRAAKAAGTPTKIALGYNEGGTVTVESDIGLTTAYATYEQLDSVNPRTSAAWDQSIMNALQIEAKSRA